MPRPRVAMAPNGYKPNLTLPALPSSSSIGGQNEGSYPEPDPANFCNGSLLTVGLQPANGPSAYRVLPVRQSPAGLKCRTLTASR